MRPRTPPRRATTAAACVVALALGACSDGSAPDDPPTTLPPSSPSAEGTAEPNSPTPTDSTPPTQTATPTPTADPFAVPDEITPAYVQSVIDEINRIDADITIGILETEVAPDAVELPERFVERTAGIYADPLLEINLRIKSALYRSADERDDLLPPDSWGVRRITVEEILDEPEDCVLFRGLTDLSEIDADPGSPEVQFFFLSTTGESTNDTGWVLTGIVEDQADPPSPNRELREVSVDDLSSLYPEACR